MSGSLHVVPGLLADLDGTLSLGVVVLEALLGVVLPAWSGFALAPWRGVTLMLITDDIFQAFLQCETKAHLKLAGAAGDQRGFPAWERHRVEAYKRHYHLHVRADCREDECLVGVAWPHALSHRLWRRVIDCQVQTHALQSHIHIVERGTSAGQTPHPPYIPVRLIPREKLTPQDKLMLAFDALVPIVSTF